MAIAIVRTTLAVAALVTAIAACGSDTEPRSEAAEASDEAMAHCSALVEDEAVYARVLDAREARGATAREWFRTRSDGAYSVTRDEALDDESSLTFCIMDAPGFSPPGPPGAHNESGAQSAIVILGLEATPTIDAIGPADRVLEIFEKLGS